VFPLEEARVRQKRRTYRFTLLFLVLAVALAGCATVSWKVPIGNYKEANTFVIENTRTIIKQANQVERAIYIDKQVHDHSRIDLEDIQHAEVFFQDQLAARMKALDTMDAYGTLLLEIVNSDVPKSIAENSGIVSQDASNLLGMMAALRDKEDAAFKSVADPAAKLVSQVAGLAMDRKIREALDKAVEAGYEPMNRLITLLGDETYGAYKRKRNQLLQEQRYLLKDYNLELKKGTSLKEDALKKYAEQIKTELNNWEESAEANPNLMFGAMTKAQVALLAYTRSDKTPKDADDFSYAMSDYLARVKQVGVSMKNLSQF
jgi:hypothetical protein